MSRPTLGVLLLFLAAAGGGLFAQEAVSRSPRGGEKKADGGSGEHAPPAGRPSESESYAVDFLQEPAGEVIEVGGMDFLPDGRLVVSTRRGRVWIIDDPGARDPARASFHLFAEGLHEGLGLKVVDGVVHVLQRGELSRITDQDGDGFAERVETLCADFGMTGNYHEFAYGLPRAADGSFFIGLNLGFWEPRWWHGKAKAPDRGWILRIDGSGRSHPFALGFRSPNGLELSPAGDLYVTDNQGDWMPACPLYLVREGGFYGHPASLQWTTAYRNEGREASDTEPPRWRREPAAVWFPYDLCRSAAGMAWAPADGSFGPFENQLFVAELTKGSILRCTLEEVNGCTQGACFLFRSGVGCANRVAFSPRGALFVGLTERGWGGDGKGSGISRVRYTGRKPFEMRSVSLREGGFLVTFTQPLSRPLRVEDVELWQHDYNWWWKYGSPETHMERLPVSEVRSRAGESRAFLVVPGLEAGRVVRGFLSGARGPEGRPLIHERFDYTVNVLRTKGSELRPVAKEVPPPPTREEELEGWVTLSDGYTLDGWEGRGWRAATIGLEAEDPTRFRVQEGVQAYVNDPRGSGDLVSRYLHGDAEVALEFCLPKGGRGGVALMGRYEIVLQDAPAADGRAQGFVAGLPGAREPLRVFFSAEERPRPPGQWQKLDLVFRAPRFDTAGNKVEPARIVKMEWNEKVVLEDLPLPGVTAGRPFAEEGPAGPLTLVGGRGQIASRGVRLRQRTWSEPAGNAFRPLLRGPDLSAWKPAGWARFALDEGVIRGRGEGGILFSQSLDSPGSHSVLRVRARVRLHGRSHGALILGGAFDDRETGGCRIRLDADGPGPARSGSVDGGRPVLTHLVSPGIWFQLEALVEERGETCLTRVRVNGLLVSEDVVPSRLAHPLRVGLEVGAGGIDWEDLQVSVGTAGTR